MRKANQDNCENNFIFDLICMHDRERRINIQNNIPVSGESYYVLRNYTDDNKYPAWNFLH